MEQLLYGFVFFYPVFLLVTVSLIVYGWLARSTKREEAQQQKQGHIAGVQIIESAVQKMALGSFAKQFAWRLFSGIVWVVLAVVLAIVLTLALFWLSRPGGLSQLF